MVSLRRNALFFIGLLLPATLASPVPVAQVAPTKYIVTFNDNVDVQAHVSWVDGVHRRSLSRRDTAGVQKVFRILPMYSGEFDEETLAEIRASPDVKFVDADQAVYLDDAVLPRDLIVQEDVPYGLAAISHRTQETGTYLYDSSAGEGTFGYVLDTGIFIDHVEFEGRASLGYNADPNNGPHVDDQGHGTHVAGTVGSRAYGVAKKASLVSVKVLGNSFGSLETILDGYDWAVNDIVEKGRGDKASINMSLRTQPVQAWDTAVKTAFNLGVTTVVSAGNQNIEATSQGPAYVPECLTIGAINSTFQKAPFSNFGSRVDVFAAGQNVLSTYPFPNTPDNNSTRTISGTSMASPHIAGLVLYLQALEGLKGPQAVADRIVELATKDAIANPGPSSPNLLAFNGNGGYGGYGL